MTVWRFLSLCLFVPFWAFHVASVWIALSIPLTFGKVCGFTDCGYWEFLVWLWEGGHLGGSA